MRNEQWKKVTGGWVNEEGQFLSEDEAEAREEQRDIPDSRY